MYYAAWKQHIGMYPIPAAEPALESRIAPYRAAKDTVRFTYKKPIPYELIDDVVADAGPAPPGQRERPAGR